MSTLSPHFSSVRVPTRRYCRRARRVIRKRPYGTTRIRVKSPWTRSLKTRLLRSSYGPEENIFTKERPENIDGSLDHVREGSVFKAAIGGSFSSVTLGIIAPKGLAEEFVLSDFSSAGTQVDDRPLEVALLDPLGLGPVDLIYGPISELGNCPAAIHLQAGDADQDLKFDQLDLVRVQIAAKFLTGAPATWGEGDWDGAPGGRPGDPPDGDGLFDQTDIVAALQGDKYLKGPYAAYRRLDATSDNLANAMSGGSFDLTRLGGTALTDLIHKRSVTNLADFGSPAGSVGSSELDFIHVQIPEPGSAMLICSGVLVLVLARIRTRGS